ncbi:MAG: ribonuclease P protein subunit [Candidatus Parvarchaeota archaeon]|nr:ribonuclease P protein subunit [Candidatus Parvarchaeota archaeon]
MLIGKEVYIIDLNIAGKVIDETKNTILLETERGRKRVIKSGKKIIIYLNGKEIKIRGEELNLRPWEYAIR